MCQAYQDIFHQLCDHVGVPIKHSKTVLPSQVVELHGLLVNTVKQTIYLPSDKRDKAMDLLQAMLCRKTTTLRQLQSLIGVLSFATRAVEGGRAFLRRLIDLTIGVKRPFHHIRITSEARKDIQAWMLFLREFDGLMYFRHINWSSSDTISLYTDSSNKGYAAMFGSHWTYGTWPDTWKQYHITIKEMFPITLALSLWADKLRNHRIIFVTDNQAIAHCLLKHSSKDLTIMRLIRSLIVCALKNNIVFTSRWIPTHSNTIADLLSRLSITQALRIAPWLDREPTHVPEALRPWI